MTNLYLLWAYIMQFWSVVIVNCANPANIQGCVRVDQWLLPAVNEVVTFYKER